MKIKIHSGFRAAQKALQATSPAAPVAIPEPKKKSASPFGGKQAPPFKKKAFKL